MARQVKRELPVEVTREEPVDVFGPLDRMFDRVFGNWLATFPVRHPMATARHWFSEAFIPVDEFRRDGSLVIRAEIPGIDPEKDVDLTVSGGVLHLSVERREESGVEEKRYVRQEMRYGCFERTLDLPEGVTESDVKASYRNGILEIVVPEGHPPEVAKIPITSE